MKQWLYPTNSIVIVNKKAQNGMSGEVGKYGIVVDLLKADSFDYEVRLESGTTGKFKEEELNYFFQLDDVMEVTHSNEKGKVVNFDFRYKQVELYHDDYSYQVYTFNQVKPVENYKVVDDEIDKLMKCIGEDKMSNADLHKKILDEKHDIFIRKNADYGDSFSEQFKEYGLLSAVIRLDDKLRRLKQLLKNKAQVKDESIRDTLVDLSNYADMTVMEIDKENEINAN